MNDIGAVANLRTIPCTSTGFAGKASGNRFATPGSGPTVVDLSTDREVGANGSPQTVLCWQFAPKCDKVRKVAGRSICEVSS